MMAATIAPFKTDKSTAVFEEAKVRRMTQGREGGRVEKEGGRGVG